MPDDRDKRRPLTPPFGVVRPLQRAGTGRPEDLHELREQLQKLDERQAADSRAFAEQLGNLHREVVEVGASTKVVATQVSLLVGAMTERKAEAQAERTREITITEAARERVSKRNLAVIALLGVLGSATIGAIVTLAVRG